MTPRHTAEHLAQLHIDPNEASGLLCVQDPALLEHLDCDVALWSVLDEVDVDDCVVVLGHRRGAAPADGWAADRLPVARRGARGRWRDAESLTAWDGWVYVFGSHHGGKSGPIRREEQWVARFREVDVVGDAGSGVPGVELTVADTAFALHRAINDGLRHGDTDIVPMAPRTAQAFVEATRRELEGTPEHDLVRPGDWTVNIEGVTFTPHGTLLLGLRFPTTADGRPVLVELEHPESLFTGDAVPAVLRVLAVDAVGRNGSMAGVRDLCMVSDTVHLVTGDLDSAGKGSVIRDDYPGGCHTVSTHFAVALGSLSPGTAPPAEVVAEFPDTPRIEGLACATDGRFFYVSDEDSSVVLRSTPLLTAQR